MVAGSCKTRCHEHDPTSRVVAEAARLAPCDGARAPGSNAPPLPRLSPAPRTPKSAATPPRRRTISPAASLLASASLRLRSSSSSSFSRLPSSARTREALATGLKPDMAAARPRGRHAAPRRRSCQPRCTRAGAAAALRALRRCQARRRLRQPSTRRGRRSEAPQGGSRCSRRGGGSVKRGEVQGRARHSVFCKERRGEECNLKGRADFKPPWQLPRTDFRVSMPALRPLTVISISHQIEKAAQQP